jgi:hypothetical protein
MTSEYHSGAPRRITTYRQGKIGRHCLFMWSHSVTWELVGCCTIQCMFEFLIVAELLQLTAVQLSAFCMRDIKQSSVVYTSPVGLFVCKKQSSPASRHDGAWGERSSYSFLTSALDGGVSGQRHAPAALWPGERTPGTHCTGPVWTQRLKEKSFRPCWGSKPDRLVQSVARHYTGWATPAPFIRTWLVY